jgi:hypothetical protein
MKCLLALLAATAFADTGAEKTESQRESNADRNGSPIIRAKGLSLSWALVVSIHSRFNGESVLVSPERGELQPQKSVFRAVLDTVLPLSSAGVAAPNKSPTPST